MGGFIGRVEGDIDEFTKLAHHLQDEISAARMVPIGTLDSRLSRAVRDAASSTGKQVELELFGSETELDNNIIQQISDPLVHLVRNSVAHGIELPERRREAGKSELGRVNLRAYHRGNHIYIEVEDDGNGIDYQRVRQTAVDRGLVSQETAGHLTERELREMLFHPGFSTASAPPPAPTTPACPGTGSASPLLRVDSPSLIAANRNSFLSCPGTRITAGKSRYSSTGAMVSKASLIAISTWLASSFQKILGAVRNLVWGLSCSRATGNLPTSNTSVIGKSFRSGRSRDGSTE